jgi:hypothetical protein
MYLNNTYKMNQAFYDEFKKNESIKMEKITTDIKNNKIFVEKLKSVIEELHSRRELELLTFAKDPSYQLRYHGAVLATNGGIWNDFDKSIEYEAIFSSILDFIDS